MKLTQEDTACFYDVFFKLIDYTNDRYQVVPGFKKTSERGGASCRERV